jgi:hypothetical protein
MRANITTVP